MEKENSELKEKLICVLKSNIEDIKEEKTQYLNGGFYFYNFFYLDNGEVRIKILKKPIYKSENIEKTYITKGKYFWQKDRIESRVVENYVVDYVTGEVFFEDVKFNLTKEEYDEIINLRKEKIKEKQLEHLNKLCNEGV